MPAKRSFDAELAALEALREESPATAEPSLARALNLRNNFLVAKAAAVTLHHHLTSLTHHLVAAFPRFLENSSKSDPQCWAKNALARALAAFEYQEPEIFLSGMRHIQREPKPSAAPPPPRNHRAPAATRPALRLRRYEHWATLSSCYSSLGNTDRFLTHRPCHPKT